jgi:carbonic anhydrase
MIRRDFIRIAALGGGLTVLGPRLVRASGDVDTFALLLSCMDYRLVQDTERYMVKRGLKKKYDHVILAGAALGALTEKFPAWNKTFWEHLDVAIELHHVKKVFLMDHRDCGAYQVVLGEDFGKTPAKETRVHAEKLRDLKKQILAKNSKLSIEMLLMNLDGKVETIA